MRTYIAFLYLISITQLLSSATGSSSSTNTQYGNDDSSDANTSSGDTTRYGSDDNSNTVTSGSSHTSSGVKSSATSKKTKYGSDDSSETTVISSSSGGGGSSSSESESKSVKSSSITTTKESSESETEEKSRRKRRRRRKHKRRRRNSSESGELPRLISNDAERVGLPDFLQGSTFAEVNVFLAIEHHKHWTKRRVAQEKELWAERQPPLIRFIQRQEQEHRIFERMRVRIVSHLSHEAQVLDAQIRRISNNPYLSRRIELKRINRLLKHASGRARRELTLAVPILGPISPGWRLRSGVHTSSTSSQYDSGYPSPRRFPAPGIYLNKG